jgi:hypothetical protein
VGQFLENHLAGGIGMSNELDLDELISKLNNNEKKKAAGNHFESTELHGLDEETRVQIMALCQSKAEEFALIGYDKVVKEDIWRYFEHRYKGQYPPLHRLVNEILGLKVTAYMNWATINAYKGL